MRCKQTLAQLFSTPPNLLARISRIDCSVGAGIPPVKPEESMLLRCSIGTLARIEAGGPLVSADSQ